MKSLDCETNKKKISFLLNNLLNYKHPIKKTLPLPYPVLLLKEDIYKINKYKYNFIKINNKDYKRGFLFLFKDGENRSFVIDENINIYSININAESEYFNNTIIEIFFNNDKIIFIDSYIVADRKITNWSFNERRYELQCFKNSCIIDKIDTDIIEVSNKIENIDPDEEILMIPELLPVRIGINYSSFCFKNLDSITFNLKAIKKKDELELYTTDYRLDKIFAKTRNDEMNTILSLENYKDNCIVQFNINNDKIVALKVLIEENIPSSLKYLERIFVFNNQKINIKDIFNNRDIWRNERTES